MFRQSKKPGSYQSEKYDQATAVSEAVVVTVVETKAEIGDVDQKSLTVFTVNFTAPVESLKKEDVTVKKVLKNGFEMTSQVKTVALAKDGMSADVTMFGNLADATTYKITVAGMETFDKVMSAGAPAFVEVFVDKADNFLVEITGKGVLDCKLYDINYVDVTTDTLKAKVNYTLEKYATDGSYYLSGKNLTIKKENSDPVVVKATYRNTVNGKVETVEGYGEFYGYKKEAPVVSAYVVTLDKFDAPKLDFQKSERPTLKLQVVDTADKKIEMTAGKIGDYGYVSFEALNPEIAVLNGTTLKAFQTGFASFLVYVDLDGTATKYAPEPVYEFTLEVKADAAYDHADLSTTSLTVSAGAQFNTNEFTVSAVDQYGEKSELTAAMVTIEGLSDQAKKVAATGFEPTVADGKVKYTVKGAVMATAFDNALVAGAADALDFKVKVNNKDEFTLTVIVQMPGESEGNYVSISAKDSINATLLNEKDMTTPQSVTFEVVEMNCEVKVGEVTGLTVLPEKTEDAVANTYYYKLLKDGKAVNATVTGNKVSFALTTTKAVTVSGSAINGQNLVSYENVGAGVYTFELYKGADQIASRTTIVNVDEKGTYNESGDQKETSVESTAKDKILACFTISDRKGTDITKSDLFAGYDVELDVADEYVFVKKITFYEKVTDGLYVDYVVDINEVLKLN